VAAKRAFAEAKGHSLEGADEHYLVPCENRYYQHFLYPSFSPQKENIAMRPCSYTYDADADDGGRDDVWIILCMILIHVMLMMYSGESNGVCSHTCVLL
jgi:hypothetical protein